MNPHRIRQRQRSAQTALRIEPLESRNLLAANPLTQAAMLEDLSQDSPSEPLTQYAVAPDDNSFVRAADLGFIDDAIQVTDELSRTDRLDYINFTIRRDATVAIDVSGMTENVDLEVFNEKRRRIGRSANRSTEHETFTDTLQAGEYTLRVRSRTTMTTPYTLNVAVGLSDPLPQFAEVADFGGSLDWSLNAIRAPEVWQAGYTGQGVTVAVVDAGVDWSHPDLAENIWKNPNEIPGDGIDNDNNGFIDDVTGWDFVENDANPYSTTTHGTHVAGTIASLHNGVGSTGVAHDATIMPIRVLGGRFGSYSDVARGIRYAVDNGADIINLSLGGAPSGPVYEALRHAANNDVFVAAASGNAALPRPVFPARRSIQFTNVISVGAYTASEEMASFSNGAIAARDVQVDAPGKRIFSTFPDARYGLKSGTSMAAPQVSGIAALMLSANPDLSASQLRDLMVHGATEYIIGRWARGGVNASVSVLAATQTIGTRAFPSDATDFPASDLSTTDASHTLLALLSQPTSDTSPEVLPVASSPAPDRSAISRRVHCAALPANSIRATQSDDVKSKRASNWIVDSIYEDWD